MAGDAGRAAEPVRLTRQFDAAMMEIYERAGREVGYWATRYLQMLRRLGGLATAKRLLHATATSDGYARLRDAGRLDLTVEAYVLREEYQALFTPEELNLARDRLEYFGHEVTGDALSDPYDLVVILQAERRPRTRVELQRTGREVAVRTLRRHERRSALPITRQASCWAPNKPSIELDGAASWPELVIVDLLSRAGWEARWTKNWAGGREFCVGVGTAKPLSGRGREVYEAIHHREPSLGGAGTWDVIAWRGSDVVFIESKQAASSDRLRDTQLAFLDAALDFGVEAEAFAIVEYTLGGGPGRSASARESGPRSGDHPAPVVQDPELARLLAAAAAADPGTRIEYRDRIAAYGSAAIWAMDSWVRDGGSAGFACVVIAAAAGSASATEAVKALRRLAASQPDWIGVIEQAIARLDFRPSPAPARLEPSGDVYVATGTPPPALGPCDVVNHDGTVCHNPGRHLIADGLSCTTHFKALTRRGRA